MPELEDEEEIVTVALDPTAWIRVTVLISLAIAIVGILCFLIAGTSGNVFQRKITLRTYFPDGTGLGKKAPVEVDGIPVGKIKSVELSHSNEPSRIVRVDLLIERRYLSSIPVDSRTEVTADNLLGDKYVNIHRGVAHESVKPDDELIAQPPDNTFDPADLIVSLRSVLGRASGILDLIEDPNSKLGQIIQGEALYDQIRNDIVNMDKIVRAYGNPKGPTGRAIFGVDLYDQLRAPINDIDKQLAAIENGEGAIGHAYASSEQYDQLRDQIAGFRKLVAGLENNKFLTSDEFYNNMRATLNELNTVITSMTSGSLFDNAQLYESLNGSSKSAAEFLADFQKDPRKYLRIKVF